MIRVKENDKKDAYAALEKATEKLHKLEDAALASVEALDVMHKTAEKVKKDEIFFI